MLSLNVTFPLTYILDKLLSRFVSSTTPSVRFPQEAINKTDEMK